ncbi:MAG: radical SAM protein [Candidatus Lokiarchaeota archaeon]|nr:radical SAM protein [Candidatus Lokiarchaeota archaeon]
MIFKGEIMWKTIRPDASSIWDFDEVKDILARYRAILDKKKLAKYLIFKKIPINIDLENALKEDLWNIHTKIQKKVITGEYIKTYSRKTAINNGASSYLDLKIELLRRIMENCHLCERNCQVNRLKNEKGNCNVPKFGKIYSAHLHFGEESPLVPSGTIFFTGCSFDCVFCQNYDISTNPSSGSQITPKRLAAVANSLARDEGAKNINYVTPLPHVYAIVASLKYQTANIAQLWNSNHYCSKDTIDIIADLFDIWLPDFKYGNDECALKLSNATKYWETLTRNFESIYKNGEIIVRHLVMPGHIKCCTKPILEWISKHTPNVLVNIMAQYRPAHLVLKNKQKYQKIARRPSQKELNTAKNYAKDLGIFWEAIS